LLGKKKEKEGLRGKRGGIVRGERRGLKGEASTRIPSLLQDKRI